MPAAISSNPVVHSTGAAQNMLSSTSTYASTKTAGSTGTPKPDRDDRPAVGHSQHKHGGDGGQIEERRTEDAVVAQHVVEPLLRVGIKIAGQHQQHRPGCQRRDRQGRGVAKRGSIRRKGPKN